MGVSLAPVLLVAAPPLHDPNFERTVVLLARHGADGAFGLVLNRPAEGADLEALARSLQIRYGRSRPTPLHVGGPVEPARGWILHDARRTWEGSEIVAPGIALSASRAALSYFAGADRPEAFRTLVGYAGWAPGQLEVELAGGSWETVPVRPAWVLAEPPAGLWERALSSIGIDPARYVSPSGIH